MRTTLDIPNDAAALLRRESARRGGRAAAPMAQLVAEAVRTAYGPKRCLRRPKIVCKDGRAIVKMPPGVRITSEDVSRALEDMV